ncbi:hypothetical protein EVAR_5996_1 [Eumeta japonica]|uniref:Uncharacterized protein n=1 Tax=Eumeta variegata TaxID=151549 RepID=A0A4C1T9H1_EUMVA|nr:hypothetical protein EVAR_5996_1 [Eumeta japonica]
MKSLASGVASNFRPLVSNVPAGGVAIYQNIDNNTNIITPNIGYDSRSRHGLGTKHLEPSIHAAINQHQRHARPRELNQNASPRPPRPSDEDKSNPRGDRRTRERENYERADTRHTDVQAGEVGLFNWIFIRSLVYDVQVINDMQP